MTHNPKTFEEAHPLDISRKFHYVKDTWYTQGKYIIYNKILMMELPSDIPFDNYFSVTIFINHKPPYKITFELFYELAKKVKNNNRIIINPFDLPHGTRIQISCKKNVPISFFMGPEVSTVPKTYTLLDHQLYYRNNPISSYEEQYISGFFVDTRKKITRIQVRDPSRKNLFSDRSEILIEKDILDTMCVPKIYDSWSNKHHNALYDILYDVLPPEMICEIEKYLLQDRTIKYRYWIPFEFDRKWNDPEIKYYIKTDSLMFDIDTESYIDADNLHIVSHIFV